jgi:hypothetical protein
LPPHLSQFSYACRKHIERKAPTFIVSGKNRHIFALQKNKITILKNSKIMKTMKNMAASVLMSILAAATFTACSENSLDYTVENQPVSVTPKAERTVLVYMAGRNNLSYFAASDLEEMKKGSKLIGNNQALLVFMRRSYNDEEPWLARIQDGNVTDKVTVSQMGISKEELFASDPEVMERVLHYAFSHYPSVKDDYGLVLWGHAGGWLLQDSVSVDPTRGYGVDLGKNISGRQGKWINMPTMNKVLIRMPHLKFLFADCCNFMCLESLYELRHTADYIIGSPAEIPAEGAPYDTVVPALFEPETYYRSIIDRYHEATKGCLPLSVVKTSEMERVALATRKVMQSIDKRETSEYPEMKGTIHYNYLEETDSVFLQQHSIFYDAGNFILNYATQSEYQEWKQALDAAVIEKRIAYTWRTEISWDHYFTDFEVSPEKYHGVSIFVPQDPTAKYGEYYMKFNKDIHRLQWSRAVI